MTLILNNFSKYFRRLTTLKLKNLSWRPQSQRRSTRPFVRQRTPSLVADLAVAFHSSCLPALRHVAFSNL